MQPLPAKLGVRSMGVSVRDYIKRRTSLRMRNRARTLAHLPQLLRIREEHHRFEDAVLVAGEMRSGTTWLGSLIAKAIHGREIFEPMNIEFTDFPEFGDPLYADADAHPPGLLECFSKILSGRLLPNHFVDHNNRPGRYRARVIKDLRMGWSLPFVQHCFPEVTTLYIIRNPFGSLRSQFKQAHPEQLDISRNYFGSLVEHPALQSAIWSRYGEPPIRGDDFGEYKMASWASHQRLVWDQLADNPGILLVSYELLMEKPSLVMAEICELLSNRGLRVSRLEEAELRSPSHTTHEAERDRVKAGRGASKWQEFFTDEQRERYGRVLSHFGLDELFDEQGQPSAMLRARCLAGRAE